MGDSNPLHQFGLDHKYSLVFEDMIRVSLAKSGVEIDPYELEWCFNQMRHRIMMGHFRYETHSLIDIEQEREIGKDWNKGYIFFSLSNDEFISGLLNKTKAFKQYGNGDLLPDIMNYCMFLFMTDDNPTRMMEWVYIACVAAHARSLKTHPTYHEKVLDQGIHGHELSGTANIKTRRF